MNGVFTQSGVRDDTRARSYYARTANRLTLLVFLCYQGEDFHFF